MSDLIVVAIPSEDDYTWKLSSEKVPHLTLLYLGKQEFGSKRQRMVDFVEHAATTSLQPFGLRVDDRGSLGDKEADVLFFNKKSAEKIAGFRSFLLANQELSEAYLSVDQHLEWLPHLTLGYPNAPAKIDTRDYPGINWVSFDRIALWDGNYKGPTVKLKDKRNWEEVSMSDIAHFGVKGMKWGVRNSGSSGSSGSASKQQKAASKADDKWVKKAANTKTFIQVYNDAAGRMNKTEISRINGKSKYQNLDMNQDTPIRRQYLKEYSDTFTRIMNEESAKRVGMNPSGTKKLNFSVDGEGAIHYHLKDVNAKHAADDPQLKIEFDDNGYIVSFSFTNATMAQGEDLVSDIIEHFGIKGMKWGIRKSDPGSSTPGSDDHSKASAALAKAKTSGMHSLSNNEMRDLLNRMNLEQQYSRIVPDTSTTGKGKKAIRGILAAGQTINSIISLLNSPAGKIIKAGLTRK